MSNEEAAENANETAFPFQSANNEYIPHRGLSKREYFAAMCLQGFIMYSEVSSTEGNKEEKVKRAISYADELLKQLSQ